MGKALKKNEDYTQLNRLKWVAWGVVNVESLERMQRRNYINHVREELKLHGCLLECGGGKDRPFYRIAYLYPTIWTEVTAYDKRNPQHAFQDVCLKALRRLDPDHANSEG